MLKGFWLCLRRFPKPELVVFACVAVLVYAFGKAVDNYVSEKAVEVYEHTHSVSKENLEIVLCPMPRVYGLRLTHFGESLPKFFNKLLFNGIVVPFMEELEAKLRKKYPLAFRGTLRHGATKCLLRRKEYKPTNPLPFFISQLANYGRCQVRKPFFMPLVRAMKDGTMAKRFLDNYFGTLDEMLLEEYPGLLDQAWVLPYENVTIEQMLDYLGVNLTRYIDEDMLRKSVQDIAGPTQTLDESLVDTRMAPNCFRHLFRRSGKQGHQRSKIVYQFRKSCPKEPVSTLIAKSPCLETADMYITMYITAYNQFTDVPAASVIVPYRVAADENTLVYVSAFKRIHKERCKSYIQEESQVTCIENCLYEKMTPENQTKQEDASTEGKMQCRLPWIDRLKRRSNRTVNLPLCHTKQELKSTIETIRTMFDITEATECSQRCPRHCDQLMITPRLAGSALTPLNRSIRLPRHPRLEVLISDALPVFSETQQYDFGKMIAQMLGNLSFLVGVSLVALYDWLIGLVLWMFGKLPFIPAMPPLIKDEIYMSEACSCAETDEERRQSIKDTMDESETFLAASFRHRRRGSVLRSFNPYDDVSKRRRRAMTLNQLPTIAIKSSAIDTVSRTFPSEQEVADVRSMYSSVGGSMSRTEHRESSEALLVKESDSERPVEGDPIYVHSQYSVLPSLSGVSGPVADVSTPDSTVSVLAGRPSRLGVLKRGSSGQVTPAEGTELVPEDSHRTGGLPSISAARPAHPKAGVTFDLSEVERTLGAGRPPVEDAAVERRTPQYRSRPLRTRTVPAPPDNHRPPH